MSGPAPAPTDRGSRPRRPRDLRGQKKVKRQPTAADMVRSLAVLLIPVVVIMALFTRDPATSPGTDAIDWQPARDRAASQAAFPVESPINLPEGWVPVRVAWEEGHQGADQRWLIGWLSPQQIYFAVEQSNAEPALFVERVTRDGVIDGGSSIAGTTWQRHRSPDDRTRALVRTGPKVTTIVVADSSYEALEAFVSTLATH